jgi:hypothetical protein
MKTLLNSAKPSLPEPVKKPFHKLIGLDGKKAEPNLQ